MVRRIKPVARKASLRAEVLSASGEPAGRREGLPSLAEVHLPADVSETESEVVIEVEVPGVDRSDLKVWLYSNRVEVTGFKPREQPTARTRFHRLEREYGHPRVLRPGAVRSRACDTRGRHPSITLKKLTARRREVLLKIRGGE
jgi:HSP20 family protein